MKVTKNQEKMTATIKFKTAENAAFVGVEEIFKKKFAKCLAKYIKDKTPNDCNKTLRR